MIGRSKSHLLFLFSFSWLNIKLQLVSVSTGCRIAVVIIFIFFCAPVMAVGEEDNDNSAGNQPSANVNTESPELTGSDMGNSDSVKPMSVMSPNVNSPKFNSQSVISTSSPDVTSSIIKVSGGLLLVIVAIFGSAWFYRRFGHFSPVANDALKVIGGLTIGQKEKIVLLQVGEEQVLVGVAPGNIQKLHVLTAPIKLKSEVESVQKPFSDQLGEALGKWKK